MISQPDFDDEKSSIDIKQYIEIVKRRLWILISVSLTIIVVSILMALRTVPVYQASATLIIEPEPVQRNDMLGVYYSIKAYAFKTQCDILLSESVVKRAIRHLDDDTISVEAFKSGIKVSPVKETYLVKLLLTHTNPEVAAKRINALAEAFIEHTREDKRSASRDSYSWLSEQLALLKAKVQKSEMALLKFKENENIVSLEKRQGLIEENLSLVQKRHMEASLKTLELETKIREINRISENPKLIESMPGILDNPVISELKTEYSAYHIELSKLSKKYKSKHPKIVQIRTQIQDVKKRIADETQKIIKGYEIEYRISKTREEAVRKNLEKLKRESMKLAQQSVQYGVLKREAESNTQMYSVLLGSLKKVDVTGNMVPNNIRIVDRAKVPERPSGNKKSQLIMMGIVLGIALGIGLVFLVEYTDDTIKNEKDLDIYLGGYLLGILPLLKKKESEIKEIPPKPLVQPFRNIRTMLAFHRKEHILKSMLITSAVAGEGKTGTAAALSKYFAESGLKVLLIDSDFFRPRIRKIFRIESGIGLVDHFYDNRDWKELIFETQFQNLYVMPSGLLPSNPANILESRKIRNLLETLKKEYDIVIFDSPPLSACIELSFLCSIVDGVVMMIKTNSTSRHMVGKMVKVLNASKSNLLGYILSHFQGPRNLSDYYYKYDYPSSNELSKDPQNPETEKAVDSDG